MKALPLAVSVVLIASSSWASTIYPMTVQQQLGLKSPPLCTSCHSSMAGGLGTAVKPFAVSLRKNGLVHQNPELLKTLLAKADADGTDSDKDGTPDIAELKAGTDPNVDPSKAPPKPATPPPPTSSCGGCAAGPVGSFAPLLGLSALALLGRRRRPAPHG